jgi:hypothetical protein
MKVSAASEPLSDQFGTDKSALVFDETSSGLLGKDRAGHHCQNKWEGDAGQQREQRDTQEEGAQLLAQSAGQLWNWRRLVSIGHTVRRLVGLICCDGRGDIITRSRKKVAHCEHPLRRNGQNTLIKQSGCRDRLIVSNHSLWLVCVKSHLHFVPREAFILQSELAKCTISA